MMAHTTRVRTSDDQEILWSQKAVQRAGTLRDMHLHTDPDGDLIVDRPAAALCVVTSICESAHEPLHPVADIAFDKLMDAIEAAHYLAADGALSCLANELFCRMSGKSVDELIAMLSPSADEAIPESERASLFAEPLFEPDDIAGYEDSIQAALTHAPTAVLCTLKAVSTTWRKRARFELCSRTCRIKGQPTPVQRGEITDLDAEYLIREGRPWDAVTAGLRLSGLARLRGYGSIVHLAMVRAADLTLEEYDQTDGEAVKKPLGGEELRACITPGAGEVPQELLAVAVASAGSGVVADIPVQRLREEADNRLATLDLSEPDQCYVGVRGAWVLASLLPISSLTSLVLSSNLLSGYYDSGEDPDIVGSGEGDFRFVADDTGIFALAEALKVNCSLTFLDISYNEVGALGGVAIAEALMVNSSLTEVNLRGNDIGTQGAVAIAEALKVNGTLTSLDLRSTQICGLNDYGRGTYTADGVNAIAEALRVSGSLTSLSLYGNQIGAEGGVAIAKALSVNSSLTSPNLFLNGIGTEGGMAIVEALKFNNSLTSIDIGNNNITKEAMQALVRVFKEKQMTCINLVGCNLGADGAKEVAEYVRVSSSLTSLDVCRNNITGVSARELALVVLGKQSLETFCYIPLKELRVGNLTTLDLSHRGIGVPGALVMAELLRTVDSLTTLNLFDNEISAEGGVAIAEALKVNGSLTALDVQYNFEGGPLAYQADAALMEAVAGREGFVLSTSSRRMF